MWRVMKCWRWGGGEPRRGASTLKSGDPCGIKVDKGGSQSGNRSVVDGMSFLWVRVSRLNGGGLKAC